ncbi:MAG: hypothetical protein ACLR1V_01520 [Coprococcus sp.]
MTFAEQVNIERKSYFFNPGKRCTIAYQACHYFLGLPDGQIKYLQVLIAVTESVCLT